jgi:hypothetical protein
MAINGGVASGAVGSSKVVIHPVLRSGGTPAIAAPPNVAPDGTCAGNYPNGSCTDARFKVDIYVLKVPGPEATAVHVIDGLDANEPAATVASLTDASVDPMGHNGAVLGASVRRGGRQSYVIASSAADGMAGASMSYEVPGATTARHVVFDAPEAADGTSSVATTVQSGRCAITITAGAGAGFTGHPLLLEIDSAANGCVASEQGGPGPGDGGVAPPSDLGPAPPSDGAVMPSDASSLDSSSSGGGNPPGGCHCEMSGHGSPFSSMALVIALLALIALRRSR